MILERDQATLDGIVIRFHNKLYLVAEKGTTDTWLRQHHYKPIHYVWTKEGCFTLYYRPGSMNLAVSDKDRRQ